MCHLWNTLSWCSYFTFLFVCEELLLKERVVDFHITNRALHGWSWLFRSGSFIYDEEFKQNFCEFRVWLLYKMSMYIGYVDFNWWNLVFHQCSDWNHWKYALFLACALELIKLVSYNIPASTNFDFLPWDVWQIT